ncbi:MAG: transglutaminase family protein, partial [Sulfuritalea sp.]|nr:transglutaminase family protein [Sulfuritalea sp.]
MKPSISVIAHLDCPTKEAPIPRTTRLLDGQSPNIQHLISARGWRGLSEFERIGAIYRFVRDEIAFGYNERDDLPASRILEDGYGQCNTKTILLMALLRAAGVPCRLHGATIHKRLQQGIVSGLLFVAVSLPRSSHHEPQGGADPGSGMLNPRPASPFQSRFESERSVLTLKSKFKKGWLLAGLWVCGEVAVRRAIHISTAP